MVIIDLAGDILSEKYDGVLDGYLEGGEDVAIAFDLPPPHVLGSSKARKLDKPVWPGRLASPPARFQQAVPSTSLCVVIPITSDRHPPVYPPDLGTYETYDAKLKSFTVYIRLEDTSKAARCTFNGLARLAPPPCDDPFDDVDSEADLAIPSLDHDDGNGGADTFHNVICGMSASKYFEVYLLAGIQPFVASQIMMSVHPDRVQQRRQFLSRVPAGVLLIHNAPGCGNSEQLAGSIALCVA